jgi:hypothetical protein
MFYIHLARELFVEAQNRYRDDGTVRGVELSLRVATLRKLLHSQSQSFNRRQNGLRPLLINGRRATVYDQVLHPYGNAAWPSGGGALLHGLDLGTLRRLPDRECLPGGPTFREIDPETYLARLYVGPPEARRFGDMVMWAVYLDAVTRMYVVWAGIEQDAESALDELAGRTDGLTSWRLLDRDYDTMIATRCRAIGTS